MTKLSNKRVKFIVKSITAKEANVKQLANLYEVSQRRVCQLMSQYGKQGKVPVLSRNRRPKEPLSKEQKQLIDKAYAESFLAATLLRLHIKKKYGVNLSHNKILEYLKQKGVSFSDEKKQKQRKYCRYERQHSFSLGHLDWHETEDGNKVLPIIDDASRKILAIGEFSAISTENAITVLEKAVLQASEYNAHIREINSD